MSPGNQWVEDIIEAASEANANVPVATAIPMRIVRAGAVAVAPPSYAHPGDAGLDLRAATHGAVTFGPKTRVKIHVGWRVELPPGHVGLVLPRSGLQDQYGVHAGVGVIDPCFRGEIAVTMFNHGARAYTIHPHDKIAQLVVVPVATVACLVVEALGETERGANGFGSSGR